MDEPSGPKSPLKRSRSQSVLHCNLSCSNKLEVPPLPSDVLSGYDQQDALEACVEGKTPRRTKQMRMDKNKTRKKKYASMRKKRRERRKNRGFEDFMSSTEKRMAERKAEDNLVLALASPNLVDALTSELLYSCSVTTLHRFLPLILTAIQDTFQTVGPSAIDVLGTLLGILHRSRSLKVYFVLFVANPEFASFWKVHLIYEPDTYAPPSQAVMTRRFIKTSASVRDMISMHTAEAPVGEMASVSLKVIVDGIDLATVEHWRRVCDLCGALKTGESLGHNIVSHPFMEHAVAVAETKVAKVFSSIARPAMISLSTLPSGGKVGDSASYRELPCLRLIAKAGDSLMQDLGVQLIFASLNALWRHVFSTPASALELADMSKPGHTHRHSKSPRHCARTSKPAPARRGRDLRRARAYDCPEGTIPGKEASIPTTLTYNVLPAPDQKGIFTCVPGVTALKDFDWLSWCETASSRMVERMVCTSAGSYIAGYLVGVRDRHWDNILVQDEQTLFHIDFGFVLGAVPPIDAPPFSISLAFQTALVRLKRWDDFVNLSVQAFMEVRKRSDEFIRLCSLVFPPLLDRKQAVVDSFLQKRLMLDRTPKKAAAFVRKLILRSPRSWETWFKQVSHTTIDPAWYGLLRRHFPPAVAVMSVLDLRARQKERKLKRTVKNTDSDDAPTVVVTHDGTALTVSVTIDDGA